MPRFGFALRNRLLRGSKRKRMEWYDCYTILEGGRGSGSSRFVSWYLPISMKLQRLVSRWLALLVAAFAVCVVPAPAAGAQKLTVAAAADLRFALDELVLQFRAAHPAEDLAITYGSSGNFFAQIQNGAPFDVFLSADVDYPRRLVAASLASKDSLSLYGAGRIVVWVPAGSPLDPAALGIHALEAASVRHIAIANPQHAPYGRAAVAALRSLGVYDRVAPKLVLGENIAQAFEFVESDLLLTPENHQRIVGKPVAVIVHVITAEKERRVFRCIQKCVPFLLAIRGVALDGKCCRVI